MNIATLLQRIARLDPGRPAVYRGAQLVADYGTLRGRVARRAAWLLRQGLQPGDRVGLWLHNSEQYLELLYAALWAGLAVVPINAKLHPREVDYIVQHAGVGLLFVDEPPAEPFPTRTLQLAELPALGSEQPEAAAHESDPQDLAWLFYTSGTTGRPKGVMLSHRNLLATTLCYQADVEQVAAGDSYVYAAPMSHGAGLYTFAYTSAGARHVLPVSGGFDPAELEQLGATLGQLCLFAAPTMVRRLVDHAERGGRGSAGFKTIVYGGGPMYVADLQRARRVLGPLFVQIYGQGETPMTISYLARALIEDEAHPRWEERLASVGVRHSVVEVRVVDEADAALPPGSVGEVVVRGDTVMRGYWRDEVATAAALRGGWLHTGDLGSLDEEGFLTLKDRSKDLIISGGSNIYPREVEEVLLRHAGVAEAAVIGVPDPEWGELVVAFVVPAGEALDTAELDALCLQQIARFKRPKQYLCVPALPKNNYGKVLKTELRRQYAGRASPG